MIRNMKQKMLAILGAFTVFVGMMYLALTVVIAYVVEDEMMRKFLQQEAGYVYDYHQATGSLPPTRLENMIVTDSITQLPKPIQLQLGSASGDQEIFTEDASHYHFYLLTLVDGTIVYLLIDAAPLLVVTNMSNEVLALFITVFIITMLAVALLAYRIAVSTTRPVQAITDKLRRHNGEKVFKLPRAKYELGFLSETLEHALNDLNQALKREREFTRDVSHELRTPLTVIKNTLMLAEQRALAPSDRKDIDAAVSDIEKNLEVLLALARTKSMSAQRCSLKAELEDAVLSLNRHSELEQIDLQIQMADEFDVQANPQLSRLLLINLLTNAVTHASQPQIQVLLEENTLWFINPVDKLPEGDITQSGVKAQRSGGLGQGLFLVKRIAAAQEWKLLFKHDAKHFKVGVDFSDDRGNGGNQGQ